MDYRQQLANLRTDIDNIDADMIKLFIKRMEISDEVAKIKRNGNIGLVDESREQQVIANATAIAPENLKIDTASLMTTLISLSKQRQNKRLASLEAEISIPAPKQPISEKPTVAYQGVQGAWSEQAALQLYPDATVTAHEYFEDVFTTVKSGVAHYGVLPIENSETGAIGEVYDLLKRHNCYIINQTWVDINHCLMAKPNTALTDIREVLSHPEGFKQCSNYLKTKAWDKTACRNTAVAAETVAACPDNRCAAIGSPRAAAHNNLTILQPIITNSQNNKTRFIAIAEYPEYDTTSDTISITFSTKHVSGALCSVLQPFLLSNINLTRIESRPVYGGKYRFFADLQANILEERTKTALDNAAALCEYFEILGCYKG